MYILPSCSYYLRRLLKRNISTQAHAIIDLLQSSGGHSHNLDQRLQHIYPDVDVYPTVILFLEELTYSHQQAQSHRNQKALDEVTQQILWWLGYDLNQSPTQAKILIVDDTIEILKLVKTILSTQGYQVDSALNGQLALSLSLDQTPDLILLDLNLPDMDGSQVYQHLQNSPQTAHIPVIFVSGKESPPPSEIQDLSPSNYIVKPFKPSTLIERVQAVLGDQTSDLSTKEKFCKIELQERQQKAFEKRSTSKLRIGKNEIDNYFFRATLDGRYLRASEKFSQLWGYESPEEMISQVTDLWQQIYHNPEHQAQWHQCLHDPNQRKNWVVQVDKPDNGLLRFEENICVVQDDYQQSLFFEGYIKLLA